MLLDRPLLVLDEAYASVDSKYDIIMNKVVSEFVSGILGPVSSRRRTLLVIAHRLTHVLALDQVILSYAYLERLFSLFRYVSNDSLFFMLK